MRSQLHWQISGEKRNGLTDIVLGVEPGVSGLRPTTLSTEPAFRSKSLFRLTLIMNESLEKRGYCNERLDMDMDAGWMGITVWVSEASSHSFQPDTHPLCGQLTKATKGLETKITFHKLCEASSI